MKKILIFSMMMIPFVILCSAQEAAYSKAGQTQTQIPKPDYQPVQDNLYIEDFNSSSGGVTDRFYYGDPCGMYANNEWEEGKALLVDGDSLIGSFRYCVYNQKMEAIVEGDTFAFAKPCELEALKIGDHEYIYCSFIRGDGEVANTWFELLCEGECCLLQRQFIKYRIDDGDGNPTNDELFRGQEYFTRQKDGKLTILYPSKKILLETLTAHQEDMKCFMKEERLRLKDQDDLVKVFAHYNMLASGY